LTEEKGKAKSTVSSQRSKAFHKLVDWLKGAVAKASSEDFDALVFRMLNTGRSPVHVIAEYGHAEKVRKLSEIWKKTEYDDIWRAVGLLRDFGAISDSEEDAEEPLFNGVSSLCDMANQAEWDKEEAEKKLAGYEKEYGTLKELVAAKVAIKSDIEKHEKRRTDLRGETYLLRDLVETLSEEKEGLELKIVKLKGRIDELNAQVAKAVVNRDLFQSQLTDLEKNLRYYKTKHGRNIKVGDLISKKDFPLMYLVVGESKDRNSWDVKIFDNKQLAELRKKYGLSKETMEGFVSKKEVIENWEVVNVGDDVSTL